MLQLPQNDIMYMYVDIVGTGKQTYAIALRDVYKSRD